MLRSQDVDFGYCLLDGILGKDSADFEALSAIVHAIEVPTAFVDEIGLVLQANGGFSRALNGSADSMAGLRLSALFPDQAQSAVGELVSNAGSEGATKRLTVELASGAYVLTAKLVPTWGDRTGLLCQLMPDLLIESSRLRFLLEDLDQGVWNFDVSSGTFRVTEAWRRMRGFDGSVDVNATDEYLFRYVHEDDRDRLSAMFFGQVDGASTNLHVQYRHRGEAGGWRWFLCRAKVAAFDAQGRPLQIVGLDTDITVLKQEEEERTVAANKLQLAIDAVGMGLWEFDSATSMVHWDDRMLALYGVTDGQNLRPDNLWEKQLHPEDREREIAKAAAALAANTDYHSDYRIVKPDGEIRHMRSAARFVAVAGSAGKLIGINLDITEDRVRAEALEAARAKLEHDSTHDALTGLANRRLLDETTDAMLAGLGKDDRFAVLQVDLDYFKRVNDTLGHAAGDQVLEHVAGILSAAVGDAGLVARIGGDEFVVLLPRMGDQAALEDLCQGILQQVQDPMIVQGQRCHFGMSIGCAVGRGDMADASDIFINADAALYEAKSAGRQCFRIHKPGTRSQPVVEAIAHYDLRRAMAEGQILCHYQPQFEARSLALIGAEALVRWACPERGLLQPSDFVDMARMTGLGAELDAYVLDRVLEQQTEWAKAGYIVPTVALNLSQERLLQPDLLDQVASRLRPHHRISFELLETAFLDDLADPLLEHLTEFRKLGICLELDDFGSGHSSVVALQAIRPDRVKIDRMLVAPLDRNPRQILILRALAEIASLEGCGVVVEGIETQAQLSAIAGLECDALQGFLLGRPQPGAEFAHLMLRRFVTNEGRSA